MRILHLSDTHGRHGRLDYQPCDLLVHSGDTCSDGSRQQILAALDWMACWPASWRILVPGNHDRWAFDQPVDFHKACASRGIIPLVDQSIELSGLWIHGLPWVCYDPAWNWPKADAAWTVADPDHWPGILNAIPPQTDILVCHQGPQQLLDSLGPGSYWTGLGQEHPGNPWLGKHLAKQQWLMLLLAGHIHDSPGCIRHGRSWVVNAATTLAEINIGFEGDCPRVESLRVSGLSLV